MIDLALDFEKSAVFLNSLLLIIPGIALVALGLFLWLAGSLRPKVFACFFSAVILISAGYASRFNLVGILVLAVLGIAAGALMSKKMLAVSAGLTAVFIAFIAVYSIPLQDFTTPNRYYNIPAKQLNFADSFALMQDWSSFVFTEASNFVKSLNAINIGILAGSGAVILLVGIFLPKLISALLCSFWGVFLVAKGMASLLLYKGTFVVTRVNDNIHFFLIIFGAMVLFGATAQLLLCPARFKKAKNDEKEDQDGDEK